jgi:hypothetical protein
MKTPAVRKLSARREGAGRRQSFPIFAGQDVNKRDLVLLVFAGNVVVAVLAWFLVDSFVW